jgi:hypothetical protein
MTLVTTPSIRERLNNNFVNFFKVATWRDEASSPQRLTPAIERLVKNEILAIKSLSVSKADAIFIVDRYDITFTLSNKFAEHFVLLRGLLEFSRPKTIRIISNRTDNTFHVLLSEEDDDHFVAHLEKILSWLVREINFKKSLKAMVNFEKKVKREQEILYANLRLTA